MTCKKTNTNSLCDKAAMVTGAARGLGKHLAGRLAEEGCHLMICDINESEIEDVKREIEEATDRQVLALKVDVTSEADVSNMVDMAVAKFSRIDFLVSNAAMSFSRSIFDFDIDLWRKMIDVNLVGYFLCAREAARVMKEKKSGSIVQINSRTGKRGSAQNSAYAASKGGGIILTQSLSAELAEFNVRVNCVCPGPMFESDLWQKVLFDDYARRYNMTKEQVKKKYLEEIPLKRGCEYEDVANLVTFLLSDASSYMTGQAINVTGGGTVW